MKELMLHNLYSIYLYTVRIQVRKNCPEMRDTNGGYFDQDQKANKKHSFFTWNVPSSNIGGQKRLNFRLRSGSWSTRVKADC